MDDSSGHIDVELPKLQSRKSSQRLEQIASLRARGIGDHVDLPQLVVCGDQSAGKSSVLEGVSGLPFPRQDGVCTKFPTEIIMEHNEGPFSIVATIIPCVTRDETSKAELITYSRSLKSFEELPEAIAEVGALMGIRGFGYTMEGPAFAEDVFRIKVSGPTGLHLTVVDLPGLISVPSEEQTEADMDTVHRMVDSYVSNPRTIILAVVQAGNDIANQGIIQKSRRFDKEGQRTVGIITKPDLINQGTEKRISLLASNQDSTKLKLGFFLLKNPTPTEIASGISADQRAQNEMRFFKSSPWKEQDLNHSRIGIAALRSFLQNLLDQHIERELPKVREEIKDLMKETERQIFGLGEERSSMTQLRMFISRVASQFHSLITAALHGHYIEADAEFFGTDLTATGPRRLRAVVHKMNTSFSKHMARYGQKRKIVAPKNSGDFGFNEGEEEDEENEEDEEKQIYVDHKEMMAWVRTVYINSRGRELPGNYNHVLLSELFHIQSSKWIQIAEEHISAVYDQMSTFVKEALQQVVKEEKLFDDLLEIIQKSMEETRLLAFDELRKLWSDEKQQPITYNHYYTDNVQKSRHDTTRNLIRKAMKEASVEEYNGKLHISNNSVDAEKLLMSLQKRVIVDMDEQACTEALAGLQAYYKVARKTFVDNVCRQAIERHMLRKLSSIFSPQSVAAYSDDDLKHLASEVPENIEKRKALRAKHELLEQSFQDLRR